MKTCNTCKTSKDESEFSRTRHTQDGLCFCCRVCKELVGADGLTNWERRGNPAPQKKEATQKLCQNCGKTKDKSEFTPRRTGRAAVDSRCKQCNATRRKWSHLKKYGLTLEGFERMLAEQEGACAICRGTNKKWCVDHNHTTGKVRAILCGGCNAGIGCLGDSAKRVTAAAAYLTKHQTIASSDCPPVV